MSGVHESLEQAEHAQHASHGGFDKRVAVTIAMIAAVLAGVSVLGHRAHNDVLRLQSEAAVKEVSSSNGWAWYQATKGRQQALDLNRQTLELLTIPAGAAEKRDAIIKDWNKKIAKYDKDLEERKTLAENAKKDADKLTDESHFIHSQGNRLDAAHLVVELGLVLGTIAILTKRKSFWAAGIVGCVLGIGITASALTMMPHHDDHSPGASADKHGDGGKPSAGDGH